MFSAFDRYWCSTKTMFPLQIIKNKLILLLLVSTLLLTGCIEIAERIDVRDDKSGTFSLSVKMFQQNVTKSKRLPGGQVSTSKKTREFTT